MSIIYFKEGPRIISTQRPPRQAQAPILEAEAVSDTEILVSWTFANIRDADTIVIERSDDGGAFAVLTELPANGHGSYSDTGLTPGTEYSYRATGKIVDPTQGTLISGYSPEASAETSDTAETLVQPTGLAVVEASRTADDVTFGASWNPVSGATSYDYWIEAGPDGGFTDADSASPNNQPGTSVASIVVPRLENDDQCVLVVRGRNANGPGPTASLSFSAAGNLKPPTLSSVTVGGAGNDDLAIEYVEHVDSVAADEYQVERNSGSGFGLIATVSPGVSPPQYTDVDRPVGSHIYRVRARDIGTPDRFSAYSAEKAGVVTPAPGGGFIVGQDFTTLTNLSQLDSHFQIQNAGNILLDPGLGLLYRFVAKPTSCSDQSLTTYANFPLRKEIWIDAWCTFSANWSTHNPNCGVGGEDYKHFLTYLQPGNQYRMDWKVGTKITALHQSGTAFAGQQLAPLNVIQRSSPINAPMLWDGLPHRYRLHYKLYTVPGDAHPDKELQQAMVDSTVTHSFIDRCNSAVSPSALSYGRTKMGANRNQGASEEMYVWYHQFYVYDSDPGWFSGVPITDYT